MPISLTNQEKIKVLDVGSGFEDRCEKEFYPEAEITSIDILSGWDVIEKGLPEGDWDVIFANHIIEHLSDPDYFLDECHRVMDENTILNIGTPNLTAWFNRILFLFGYVPHSVELSTKFNVGKPFNWGKEPLGGHKYIYTLPALMQLLKHHGFKTIYMVGEYSTYPCNFLIKKIDRFMTILSPTFASAIRVIAKKC